MTINKIFLEPDGLVVGDNQLVASGGGISIGQNLVVQGAAYMTTGLVVPTLANNQSTAVGSIRYNNGVLDVYNGTSWATLVTGLRNFTESLSTTAPNATVPATSLTATNAGYANIDFVIAAKGTGAILAQVPDGTTTGGNKRGIYAVDFQRTRSNATNVAQGDYSVIVGGNDNAITSSTIAYSVIVGGNGNRIEGGGGWSNQAIVGGSSNTIAYAWNSAIVAGSGNRISPSGYMYNQVFIGGGSNNTADSDRSGIVGGDSNTTNGFSSFIGGGRSNTNNSYWGGLVAGRLNSTTAPIDIAFSSIATKTAVALSVDNANIKAGMIYANRQNSGNLGNDGDVYVVSYAAAGSTFATSSGSGTSTIYTLLHAGAIYAVDTWIVIAGVTLTSGSINGVWMVTGSSSGSVSFANNSTGTISVQGTIKQSTTIVMNTAPSQSYNNGTYSAQATLFYPGAFIGGGANNQANGMYSVVAGGGDYATASNRNTASGDWSFTGGGQKNTNSGLYATLSGGYNNSVSGGAYAVIGGGSDNYAGYNWSTVAGGKGHQNNMAYGAIMGGSYGDTRAVIGFHAFPACFAPIAATSGVSQGGLLILARQTIDATATVLRSDNSAASSSNQIALPSNSAYYVKGSIIATVTGGGNTKAWTFECVIKRALTAVTASIVGNPIINVTAADAGASTWTIALSVDTTNGALAVTVTGQVANTIRWVCKAETTEVTF